MKVHIDHALASKVLVDFGSVGADLAARLVGLLLDGAVSALAGFATTFSTILAASTATSVLVLPQSLLVASTCPSR